MKTKFRINEKGVFHHFGIILNQRPEVQKYASFEGVEIDVTPLFYRQLDTKKALPKSALFENSRERKMPKLVQNVKNQFFHQLSSGGIWVIQSLTFGVNLSYL